MARLHPYNFTYKLLPQLAWRRPGAVRHELSDTFLARELLHYVWEKAAENLPADERVAFRGLHLSWHEVAGRATALLQLPAPLAISEAYYAALVYDEEGGFGILPESEEETDEPRPRYFTLAATLGLSRDAPGSPTALSEWAGEHHRPLGAGPAGGLPTTAAAFLQALAAVLGPPPAPEPVMRILR